MIIMYNKNKFNKIQEICNKKINLKNNKKFKNKICQHKKNKISKRCRMSRKKVNSKHNHNSTKLVILKNQIINQIIKMNNLYNKIKISKSKIICKKKLKKIHKK